MALMRLDPLTTTVEHQLRGNLCAMATDDVAFDCFLNIYRALSSTVRPRDAAPAAPAGPAGPAGHALSMTRVSNFSFKNHQCSCPEFVSRPGLLHVQAVH